MNKEAAPVSAASELQSAASRRAHRRRTGSLTRRMIGVAALWIVALLLIACVTVSAIGSGLTLRRFLRV